MKDQDTLSPIWERIIELHRLYGLMSLQQLADALNSSGINSLDGGKFTFISVRRLCRRLNIPIYKGRTGVSLSMPRIDRIDAERI